MKLRKYLSALGCIILAACSSEQLPEMPIDKNDFAYIEGDNVIVNMSIDAPDMQSVASRALTKDPDYNDMHLYLVEFDDNGGPLVNTLRKVYTPEQETPQSDRVVYKVMLDLSDQARVLHLIALPKNEKLNIGNGLEAQVIPALKTTDGTPAYWRRLTFPGGYGKRKADNTIEPAKELDQLQHVALVRNFACISFTNETNGDFILTDFAIINNPSAGTVAPYNTSTYTFPDFLEEKDGQTVALGYSDLSASYNGIPAEGLSLLNQEVGPVVDGQGVEPKYIYERPFNSIRHTFIIIKGHRKGDSADSYYKLDLGKNDNDGIFRYYSLLRNYNYNVRLKSVAAKGYSSVADAVSGVVYNNFSFDVELSSMLNISDGDEVVYVNFTTAVLTDPEPQELEFKYRYRSLTSASPTYNNDNVSFIGLEKGDVIEDIVYGTSNDADGWRTITLTIKAAQTETKTQSFTIVKKSGLGRTINLILHRKWTLSNVKEYQGTLENWGPNTSGAGIAGTGVGDDLTIFFDVPDNLEEAMFPMVFTLESDHQNIENNPLGKLIVTYGTSGFNGLGIPGIGNIQGNRIKYEKSLSWTEYNDPLLATDPYDNGTVIENADGTKTHRLRCRFRTVTALSDLEIDGSETTVLITNPNFNYAIVKFKRGNP